ncbi:MAG: ATP-binding protein [Bdellovibrionota bacterium]|nr:ATP-binding protein [Bdellovibrionota bacterium]
MKAPLLPIDELERLDELESFEILDSEAQVEFDQLTELAQKLFNMPIVLVSLIDAERQWFKSKQGLDACETGRDVSFCGHAILGDEIFEIKNSMQDERFADNPLVTGEPKVIYYIGCPLKTPTGYKVGTLCMIDHKPNSLTDEQKHIFQILANQVMSQMILFRQNKHLKYKMDTIAAQYETITENRARLINNARLASLGKMAGGIAHEVNNPLAILKMASRNLLREIDSESPNRDKILKSTKTIDDTVIRINKTIQSLRSLSRQATSDPAVETSLHEIIENTLSVCEEKFKNHQIFFNVKENSNPKVLCRPNEISQVLLNLLNNSYDAVEELEDKWIQIVSSIKEDKVILSVIDSGSGIPKEISDEIMQPFYTTKPIGKGTGLGLSISKNLLETQQGELRIDHNHPNTKFDIVLMLASEK